MIIYRTLFGMKIRFLFLIVFIFHSILGFSQTKNSLQQKVDSIYKLIIHQFEHRNNNFIDSNDRDSLDYLNDDLSGFLIHSKQDTNIFNVTAGGLEKVAISKDHKFRLISWNTLEGGTMYGSATVAVWKDKNNIVHAKKLLYEEPNNMDEMATLDSIGIIDADVFYESIYQIKIADTIYYLCVGSNNYSSQGYFVELNVFFIKDNYLDAGKIIMDEKKLQENLTTEFEYQYLRKHGIKKYPTITFNKKTKSIIVPEVNEHNRISYKRYILREKIFSE